jgi:hypothetical protein
LARLARCAGCQVVLDGAPRHEVPRRTDLLAMADVIRADAREATLL